MKESVALSIIGAGSSYTPEIIEGLANNSDCLPITEITLTDIDQNRLETVAGFCRRFLKNLGSPICITTTTDRKRAIDGAQFIITQIRVGGNQQRVKDEKIPMKYGLIGQETTGPGGMLKAFRTIPVMLEIAKEVAEVAPDAWMINYTNPTGLIAEAINKYSQAKIAGLCSGGLFPGWFVSRTLNVPFDSVHYRYFGLNHLNFAYEITVDGRNLTEEEFDLVSNNLPWGEIDPVLIRTLRMIPSPYLQYFYHTSARLKEMLEKDHTRGEEVMALEKEIFRAYADEKQTTKPEALAKRGGGGYSEIALGVMKAIHTDQANTIIINVPNHGAVDMLPDDAVVEIPCVVNASGIQTIRQPSLPKPVWGLVAAVKNYEQLAVEAAVTGNRDAALLALLAHPLVHDYDIAKPLLSELLEANRSFLPQFFQ